MSVIEVPIVYLPDYAGPEGGPLYAHEGDAGADVYAKESITLAPGERRLVGAGFCLAVPPGTEVQVRSKSGRALKAGLVVANQPGTIDAPYRGEVGVILHNINPALALEDLRTLRAQHQKSGRRKAYQSVGRLIATLEDRLVTGSITIERGEKIAQIVGTTFLTMRFIPSTLGDTSRGSGGFGSSGLL